MSDLEEWKKEKINGKIVKVKHYKTYIQLHIFNRITTEYKIIFVFDVNVKNFVLGLDLEANYSFFCKGKKAKDGKVYNELVNIDNIHKMRLHEVYLANMFYLSKKNITEHRGTWNEDMIRVDKIYKECEKAIKLLEENKNKKYWQEEIKKEEILDTKETKEKEDFDDFDGVY